MTRTVSQALHQFTRIMSVYGRKTGLPPISHDLYGIPSRVLSAPVMNVCTGSRRNSPQTSICSRLRKRWIFSCTRISVNSTRSSLRGYAGCFEDIQLSLVQVWSEDDFIRLQENLIGHLVTQRRLKLPPTQFIATLESEFDMISVCNLSGEVILETFGTTKRRVLAADTASFLSQLTAVCTA